MGFSLRKLLDESVAQVNPFDGGKTAATVRAANNRPAPAMTPAPGSIRTSVPSPVQRSYGDPTVDNFVQDHFKAKTAPMGGFNPAPKVDPFQAPKGASQVYHDPAGNVTGWEDAGGSHLSPMSVKQSAAPAAPTKPADDRGILRKMYDQLNPADSDRSFKNPTPTKEAAEESAMHQLTHSGINNAAGSVLNNITAIPSIIDTGRLGIAEATHNQDAIDNATTSLAKNLPRFLPIGATESFKNGFGQDIATAVTAPLAERDAKQRADYARRIFNNNTGDPVHDSAVDAYASSIENELLNEHMNTAGFNQDTSMSDIVRKVGGDATSTAANIAMFGTVPGLAEASLPVRAAGYGGINATSAVADTAANNPNATAMDYVKAGGEGFVTGAGFIAAPKLLQFAHEYAPTAAAAMKTAANDATRAMTPQYAGMTQKEIIMNPKHLDVLHDARRDLSTNHADVNLAQDVITGLHDIKKTYGHDFINGSRADRMQRINQFLENNGEAIPEYQKHLSEKQAIHDKAAASGQGGYVKIPGGGKDKNLPNLNEAEVKKLSDIETKLSALSSKETDIYKPRASMAYKELQRQADELRAKGAPETLPADLQDLQAKLPKGYKVDKTGSVYDAKGTELTTGKIQELTQEKFLTDFEHASQVGDHKTMERISVAHPGDKRVQVDTAADTPLSAEAKQKLMQEARAKAAATKPLATESTTGTPPKAQTQAPATSEPKANASSKSSKVKLNTKRLDVNEEAQARLDQQTSEVIAKLTNKEVAEAAKSAGIDIKSYGIEGTKKKIAEQLNQRNRVTTIEKQIEEARKNKASSEEIAGLMKQSAEAGRVAREQGTDLGRQLQARRIIADQLATPQQKIFRLLDEAGVDPEVYTKRLADVDMKNTDDVVKAYREMVPAKAEDWLDKYRYTNMLSSPLTHVVNITSNIEGLAGVAPVQKAIEGGIDAVKSAITGSERTRYAGESGAYMKGVAKSVPEAVKVFKDVMTGKHQSEYPDMQDAIRAGKLGYGKVSGAADTILSIVPRFLEAADQAGMTLAKSGEMDALMKRQSKGVKVTGDIAGKAEDAAHYRLFRQELGKEGQGYVLDAFDYLPQQLIKARRAKSPIVRTISKYTLPFVTTPTNLFKQGIEYSPAGVITLAGNADKVAQLAKITMGTATIGLAAGAFAANDAITFSEPSDSKQRDAFRAEGKQAYSVKIGNTWVSYSKLHPAIAFNFAAVAAVKDGIDKGNINESQGDAILRTASGVLGFFRDQSYMKAVGDFSSNLQLKDGGDLKSAFATVGSNYANQLAPFKSLTSWIGRQIDPTQRKTDTKASAPEQIYQNIVKDIPGLNKNVPARTDPYTGNPIINELDRHNGILPSVNALNPAKASTDKGYGTTTGMTLDDRLAMLTMNPTEREQYRQEILNQKGYDKKVQQEKDAIKSGEAPGTIPEVKGASNTRGASTPTVRQLSNGKYYAKIGDEYKTFDDKASADESVNKEVFRQSGAKSKVIGDNYFYKDKKGTVRVEDKFDHDYKNQDAALKLSMSTAENTDDYGKWEKAAVSKLNLLTQKADRLDPDIDSAEIALLQMQADDLITKVQKYRGYGNSFDKPKKGGKNASSNGLDYSKTFAYGTSGSYNGKLRSLVANAKVGK